MENSRFFPCYPEAFPLRELIRALARTNTKRCKYYTAERLHGYNCNHVTILLLLILLRVCKMLNINILLCILLHLHPLAVTWLQL